jgi:hypothetical protein
MQEMFMPRDDLGRWVTGTSANPGGRTGVLAVIKASCASCLRAQSSAWASCWTATTSASGSKQ